MGAEDREGREEGRPAGVQRRRSRASSPWRCSSTPPATRTAASWRPSRSCSAAPSRPRRASGRRSRAHPSSCCTGAPISSFPAFVTSVSAKYTLFTSERPADPGPVLGLARGDAAASSGGRTRPRAAMRCGAPTPMVAGDSLASVAYAEYGDPAAWRAVARFNGIDDPLRCRAGYSAPAAASRGAVSMSSTNTFLVEIDGTALPEDMAALLIAALRRRQPAVPRPVRAAVPRPGAPRRWRKTGAKVGSTVKISVSTSTTARHPSS